MAYDKIKWVNNQTKLSATNFNHMEQGIEDAHSIAEEANRTATAAYDAAQEAKDTVETLADEIADLSDDSKQDILVSGENIKTINGQSILGEGNLIIKEDEEINYQELEGVSLNSLHETGVYNISGARNVPSNTSDEGTLVVTKLNDNIISQEWKSKINNAQRLLDINNADAGNIFTVNGVEYDQGTVNLPACGTYELQGNLVGNIVIGNNEGKDTLNNRTVIILKGVNIWTNNAEAAIDYTPEDKKLAIYVDSGSENFITVESSEEAAQGDKGAINSENGLVINGVGYLSIRNTKGHGIKAAEVYIDGNPHIYIDSEHDAIHGKNLLKITNGYFYIANCNDAFSAGKSDETDITKGRLLILGGTYDIIKTHEAAFDCRASSASKVVLNATINFGSEVAHAYDNHDGANPIKFLAGLNTITGKTVEEVNPSLFFGPARVLFNGLPKEPSGEHEYTIDNAGTYTLVGDFSGYTIISQTVGDAAVNLYLSNVYYNDTETIAPFITHSNSQKRVKFDSEAETINFIRKAKGNIIESAGSVQFDGKCNVIIDGCGTAECGISAPNGYVLLANDALRSVSNCKVGIHADNIRLGKDLDDIYKNKYSCGDAPIYLLGSTIDAKITNNYYNQEYVGRIFALQYHTGITLLGIVAADEGANAISIEALGGNVIQKQESDKPTEPFANSAILYTLDGLYEHIGNVKLYVEPIGVKAEFTDITSDEAIGSPWTVYAGDGYSKAVADEKFVSKAAYDALKAELDARAPKKISIINFVPGIKEYEQIEVDGKMVDDKSRPIYYPDGRPAKDHAYCPVDISGETTYIVDSVEIYRYACPEQIDIDSTVDEDAAASTKLEPETHLKYLKDGRLMYARDGDFGYPEIDGTGQFNFKPNFNVEGYVLKPIVTDKTGALHNDKTNKCYNNFKTPWLTGIPGVYRYTKICKDINIELVAVDEAALAAEANVITWRLVAPEDYIEENLPTVRVFRCGDQAEKYFKYYLDPNHATKYPSLSDNLISGSVLEFTKQETAEGEDQVWETTGITYDDGTGYPEKTAGKIVFLFEHLDRLPENWAITASTNSTQKPVSAGDYGPTKQVTKISGDITITIKVAPPISITYDNDDNLLTYPDGSKTAVAYGFNINNKNKGYDAADVPTIAAQGSGVNFTVIHSEGDTAHGGYGWTEAAEKDPVTQVKPIYKGPDDTYPSPTNEDVYPYIASITIGETVYTPAEAIDIVTWTKKKAKITLKAELTTGDIVVKLAPRPGERSWPVVEPPVEGN